jgi:very-short-patch-repair endonuclease
MPLLNYNKLSDIDKKNYIDQYYTQQGLSFADMAEQFNTYPNRIRRDAKKFGIPIRDKSSAQINALKTGKHNHPTKGKKRDQKTKEKIGFSVMKSWENLNEAQLIDRKNKSRLAWEQLGEDQKANIISLANQAVRQSSKTGSKLEKFLLEKLLQDGHVVEFHKEQILSNTKLQIDLFLPILNIAIEVDGPSHFAPVWGEDALKKNQKYDRKKTGLIIGKGLFLIRIKQTNDYSKARALVIYEKLQKAIDNIKLNTTNKTNIINIEDTL